MGSHRQIIFNTSKVQCNACLPFVTSPSLSCQTITINPATPVPRPPTGNHQIRGKMCSPIQLATMTLAGVHISLLPGELLTSTFTSLCPPLYFPFSSQQKLHLTQICSFLSLLPKTFRDLHSPLRRNLTFST